MAVSSQIRGVLNNIGLPQHQYAGHSFRIGAGTTAALAGVEDSVIQTLGGHSRAKPPKKGGLAKLTTPQGCSVVGSSRQSCDGGGSIDHAKIESPIDVM